jgi:hypothetical protein
MICTRPPKKKAAGSTMRTPAGFSSPLWYMPSMNDVVANAVTAHAAGSAIPGGAVALPADPGQTDVPPHPMSSSCISFCVWCRPGGTVCRRESCWLLRSPLVAATLPAVMILSASAAGTGSGRPDAAADALAVHEAAYGHGRLPGQQLDVTQPGSAVPVQVLDKRGAQWNWLGKPFPDRVPRRDAGDVVRIREPGRSDRHHSARTSSIWSGPDTGTRPPARTGTPRSCDVAWLPVGAHKDLTASIGRHGLEDMLILPSTAWVYGDPRRGADQ